jgi:hypothetical protein
VSSGVFKFEAQQSERSVKGIAVPPNKSLQPTWQLSSVVRRHIKLSRILGAAFLIGGIGMSEAQDLGIIGEIQEDGFPVVFKFVDEYPSPDIRTTFSWLTVISWKYDGQDRNGMPPEEINQRMIALEHAIEESLQDKGFCRHAYSRTGNHRKELVYYITDREDFMAAFNEALESHPRYPIEINFYEDLEWQDLQKILEMFDRGD